MRVQVGGTLRHTVHKVREINGKAAFFGIRIRQKAIVAKFPAKGVRDDDDDTAGLSTLGRTRNVGGQAMDVADLALGLALVNVTAKAVCASHFEV